jgi:putative transposase
MIEPRHPVLPVGKQCALLSISRLSFYYTPKGESEMNLALMRQIDEQFPPLGGASLTCRAMGDAVPRRPPDDLVSEE